MHESVQNSNVIERVFDREGAIERLPFDADDAPEMRGSTQCLAKGFLTEDSDGARRRFARPDGEHWGRAEAQDATQRLIDALAEAPEREGSFDSPEEVLSAIDGALEDLSPHAGVLILLVGDWSDVFVGLGSQTYDGYLHGSAVSEADRLGEQGRYREHPLLWVPDGNERVMYVVEPNGWGVFVRAQVEGGTDVLVEVDLISTERARELLGENPDLVPEEPEEAGKLRKLQTFVELGVYSRTEFRVADSSHARRVRAPA